MWLERVVLTVWPELSNEQQKDYKEAKKLLEDFIYSLENLYLFMYVDDLKWLLDQAVKQNAHTHLVSH